MSEKSKIRQEVEDILKKLEVLDNTTGKVKLFTHTDLDGVGCAILAKMYYGPTLEIEYCNYEEINTAVMRFLTAANLEEYQTILITDISVDIKTANYINNVAPNKVILLDHHKSAKHLNEFTWAKVTETDDSGVKICGTALLYDRISVEYPQLTRSYFSTKVKELVSLINKYDTWLWAEEGDFTPKKLNNLFQILGRDPFIDKIMRCIKESEALITKADAYLLEVEEARVDRYINDKNQKLIKRELLGYHVGIVFAESHISELGNKLCDLNRDIDFVIIIDMSRNEISYRTIKDIDLSAIAKKFGGGGHLKSAGSPIPAYVKEIIFSELFK